MLSTIVHLFCARTYITSTSTVGVQLAIQIFTNLPVQLAATAQALKFQMVEDTIW